jgi:hypothetical protein
MRHTIFREGIGTGGPIPARGYTAPRGAFRLLARTPWLLPLLGPSLRKTASALTPASVDGPSGAGITGILTTAGDLFRWRLALQGSDPLNETARRRLRNWLGPMDRTDSSPLTIEGVSPGYQCAILDDERRHLIVVAAVNNDLGWTRPILDGIERNLYGGSDPLLTFSVFAVCVAGLFLVLGVTHRSKRGSFGRRSRPNPFPF